MAKQKEPVLGRRVDPASSTDWVQTERSVHLEWARLAAANPRASALLHLLVSFLEERESVVISRSTLARQLGCSEATVKRAVADLKAGFWIQVVQLGGKGGVNAYVLNSRVAWNRNREQMKYAMFSATVIATPDEQSEEDRHEKTKLRRMPVMYAPVKEDQ